MLLGPVAVLAKVTLNDVGNVAAIIAAVVSLLFLAAAILTWARKRWLLRNPVKVSYLVPKAEYARAVHPGAPDEEQTPSQIVIAPGGIYELIYRLVPRQPVLLDSVRFEFWGPSNNKPQDQGESQPWVVDSETDRLGEPKVMDWHEVWHQDRPLPRMLPKNQVFLLARRVRPVGEWEGTSRLLLTMRAEESGTSKVQTAELPFRVGTEDEDQLPFLRRQG